MSMSTSPHLPYPIPPHRCPTQRHFISFLSIKLPLRLRQFFEIHTWRGGEVRVPSLFPYYTSTHPQSLRLFLRTEGGVLEGAVFLRCIYSIPPPPQYIRIQYSTVKYSTHTLTRHSGKYPESPIHPSPQTQPTSTSACTTVTPTTHRVCVRFDRVSWWICSVVLCLGLL